MNVVIAVGWWLTLALWLFVLLRRNLKLLGVLLAVAAALFTLATIIVSQFMAGGLAVDRLVGEPMQASVLAATLAALAYVLTAHGLMALTTERDRAFAVVRYLKLAGCVWPLFIGVLFVYSAYEVLESTRGADGFLVSLVSEVLLSMKEFLSVYSWAAVLVLLVSSVSFVLSSLVQAHSNRLQWMGSTWLLGGILLLWIEGTTGIYGLVSVPFTFLTLIGSFWLGEVTGLWLY